MAKYLRISMGDDPEQLIDIFPTQEVGRVSWEDDGAGGVSVTAAPAGEVGPARRSIAGRTGTEIVGALTGKLAERSEELRARGRESMKRAEEAEAAAEKARNPERKREPENNDAES